MDSKTKVIAYTDGSCWNTKKNVLNARTGGIGGILSINDYHTIQWIEFSQGKYLETTSNRMEIRAFIKAMELSPVGCEIEIHTDSTYVSKSFNSFWFHNFKISTFKKRNVTNDDLWIDAMLIHRFHIENSSIIKVSWTKGHNKHPLNEKADELAGKARKEGKYTIECRKAQIN